MATTQLTTEQRKQTFDAALEIEEQLAELNALRQRALEAFAAQEQRLRVTHKHVMDAAVTGRGEEPGQPIVSPAAKPRRGRPRKQPAATPPAETGEKRASPEASARTATATQAEEPAAAKPALEAPAPRVPCANCTCSHSIAEHTKTDAVTLTACRTPGCKCKGFVLGEVHGWRVDWSEAAGVPGSKRVFTLTKSGPTGAAEVVHGPLFFHGHRLVTVKGAEDVLAVADKHGRWPRSPHGKGVHVQVLTLCASALAQQARATATPGAQKAARSRKPKEQPEASTVPAGQQESADTSPAQAEEAVTPPVSPPAAQRPATDSGVLPGQLELGVASPESPKPAPAPTATPAATGPSAWRVELAHPHGKLTRVWLVGGAPPQKHAATWWGGGISALVMGHTEGQPLQGFLLDEHVEARRWWTAHVATVVEPLAQACREGKVPGLRVSVPKSPDSEPYVYSLSGGWRLETWLSSEEGPHAVFVPPAGPKSGRFRFDKPNLVGSTAADAAWVGEHLELVSEAEDLAARGFLPELTGVSRG